MNINFDDICKKKIHISTFVLRNWNSWLRVRVYVYLSRLNIILWFRYLLSYY